MIEILMPALSPTMEEGTIVKWLFKKGDKVSEGDIIAEIETDKAIMELESIETGIIEEIFFENGEKNIKVNTPIATISLENESKINKSTKKIDDTNKKEGNIEDSSSKKTLTVREAIKDALSSKMKENKDVFIIGEEIGEYQGAYKVTQGLLEEFGKKRVIDTPITEHGFTGLAIGSAFAGLRPVVEFMTFNFSMQAIDQIINSAAKTFYMSGGKMNCSIVFRGPNGAASRVAAQHSQDFSAWYASIPGLKVICPFTAFDAYHLLRLSIDDDNPVIFLENEILYGKKFEMSKNQKIPEIGKAKIFQEGTDLTLISYGIGMSYSLEALKKLEKDNFSIEIIDLLSLRPIDKLTILESVKKTNRCIIVEEAFPVCSIGNYITSIIVEEIFDFLDAPILNVTNKDVPMPYAENLEKEAILKVEDIVKSIKKIMQGN